MTRRIALFLLTATLGMAAAQTSPAPARSGVTNDTRLSSALITVNTGSFKGPLSALLSALAKSAGYEVVFNFNVDALPLVTDASATTAQAPATASGGTPVLSAKPVAYNLINRPFNEVWPLLMDVYELQYDLVNLGKGQVLRISQRPAQLAVPLRYITAKYAEQKSLEFFGTPRYFEVPIYDNAGKAVDKARQQDGYDLPGSMRIIADVENNRLIAGGTSDETAKIRSFIATIDIPKSASPVTPQGQVIYTANSSPADVNNVLKSQFPDLKVTPIGQTPKLIISGSKSDLDAAVALLTQIDTPVAPGSVQQVYTVKGAQDDAIALLSAQYPGLKVTPVGKTGQLVINGPQSQVTAALSLLSQVDKPAPAVAAAQTVQKVFQLVNASAEEVKATLEGTLSRDLSTSTGSNLTPNSTLINPITGQPYTSGSLANVPTSAFNANGTPATSGSATSGTQSQTNAATIIADKRTNTLIVRGTPEQVNQVADLIPQLDTRVPQINVQVRIQEITEKASRSLGVDWKLGFAGFNVTVGGTKGLTAAFDPTQSLVGFNIGPTLNTLETQGLTKSIYDGSITMQSGQRSLGSNTDTQNASSTAAATIKSGGRLELNIPSAAANVPAIQKQIDYGVNLDFYSPQVAPDGTITMRVRGQVNDLQTTVTATTVPNLLQFTNSEAQTTLSFKTGQTVLLSGLLSTKESKNSSGVPFLSGLPVVGGLFGNQASTKDQRQLLVVITGNIVQ